MTKQRRNIRIGRKKYATICFTAMAGALLLLGVGSDGYDFGVDAVSGASKPIENNAGGLPETMQSLSGESLAAFVNLGNNVCFLATINGDGSPFAELIKPQYGPGQVLRFGASPGPTRENIDRSGLAFLTVFGVGHDDTGNRVRMGARLVLEVQDDAGAVKRQTKGVRAMAMTIVQVLPL